MSLFVLNYQYLLSTLRHNILHIVHSRPAKAQVKITVKSDKETQIHHKSSLHKMKAGVDCSSLESLKQVKKKKCSVYCMTHTASKSIHCPVTPPSS